MPAGRKAGGKLARGESSLKRRRTAEQVEMGNWTSAPVPASSQHNTPADNTRCKNEPTENDTEVASAENSSKRRKTSKAANESLNDGRKPSEIRSTRNTSDPVASATSPGDAREAAPRYAKRIRFQTTNELPSNNMPLLKQREAEIMRRNKDAHSAAGLLAKQRRPDSLPGTSDQGGKAAVGPKRRPASAHAAPSRTRDPIEATKAAPMGATTTRRGKKRSRSAQSKTKGKGDQESPLQEAADSEAAGPCTSTPAAAAAPNARPKAASHLEPQSTPVSNPAADSSAAAREPARDATDVAEWPEPLEHGAHSPWQGQPAKSPMSWADKQFAAAEPAPPGDDAFKDTQPLKLPKAHATTAVANAPNPLLTPSHRTTAIGTAAEPGSASPAAPDHWHTGDTPARPSTQYFSMIMDGGTSVSHPRDSSTAEGLHRPAAVLVSKLTTAASPEMHNSDKLTGGLFPSTVTGRFNAVVAISTTASQETIDLVTKLKGIQADLVSKLGSVCHADELRLVQRDIDSILLLLQPLLSSHNPPLTDPLDCFKIIKSASDLFGRAPLSSEAIALGAINPLIAKMDAVLGPPGDASCLQHPEAMLEGLMALIKRWWEAAQMQDIKFADVQTFESLVTKWTALPKSIVKKERCGMWCTLIRCLRGYDKTFDAVPGQTIIDFGLRLESEDEILFDLFQHLRDAMLEKKGDVRARCIQIVLQFMC